MLLRVRFTNIINRRVKYAVPPPPPSPPQPSQTSDLVVGAPLVRLAIALVLENRTRVGNKCPGYAETGKFPICVAGTGASGPKGRSGRCISGVGFAGEGFGFINFFFTTAAFFSDYLTTARDNVVAKYQRNHRHSDLPPALSLLLILPHLLRPPPDLVLRRRRAPRREILFNLEDIPPRTTGRPWRILRLPRRNIMAGSAGADQAFLGLISSSYTYIHDTLYSSVDLELLRTP